MDESNSSLSNVEDVTGGGSRSFGKTEIFWEPASDQPGVKVTVKMLGQTICEEILTPVIPAMKCNQQIGEDSFSGTITAKFGPTGKSGTLYGDLQWEYDGVPGVFEGFIGSWGEE